MQVEDIKIAVYNPRKMSDKSKEALKTSIEEFGEISGITWNKRTGNLVGGNHRWEQLCEMYGKENIVLKRIPKIDFCMIFGKKKFTGYLMRIVDWELTREKAANISANSEMMTGEFTSGLQDILAEISEPDSNFSEDLFTGLRLNALKFDVKVDDMKFDFNNDKDEDFFIDDDADVADLIEPDAKKEKEIKSEFSMNFLFNGRIHSDDLLDDIKKFLETNYNLEYITIKNL